VQTNAGSTEVVSPLLATGLGPDEIPQSTEQSRDKKARCQTATGVADRDG
jgi:hypothetical protein